MTVSSPLQALPPASPSDPSVSAFVDASAGSGKTKLLTDRLLRLLLAGGDPGRVLCLTFTKAAAAEMAIRLRQTLARWVSAVEDALAVEIAGLGVSVDGRVLDFARSLFGIVLDVPGGIKIGTIHSFCQTVLRRFPLEANVSPYFIVEDDVSASLRRRRVRDEVLGNPALASDVAILATYQSDRQFSEVSAALTESVLGIAPLVSRFGVDGVISRQRRILGCNSTVSEIMVKAVAPDDEGRLAATLRTIAELGSATARSLVLPGLAWLGSDASQRVRSFENWCDVFLTAKGEARAERGFANKKLLESHPGVMVDIIHEQARLIELVDQIKAAEVGDVSAAMVRIAGLLLEEERAEKARSARLDYGDLIVRTRALLNESAAWVLYKMDQGIDHILLDEVQDISPEQWAIISAIADEFYAGDDGRDEERTVFAVGDKKQSIYSFQGADLSSFDTSRQALKAKADGGGAAWIDGTLATSYRTTAPVLEAVDATFADPLASRGVSGDGDGEVRHVVSRLGQAGSVTVWPLAEAHQADAAPEWDVPLSYQTQISARRRLAAAIAKWIAGAIGTYYVESRGRTLRPSDVLILVRSRNDLGREIVRACKDAGVPVAGLDRIGLNSHRAVADLLAVAEAVSLPSHDLSVATFLASPIGGLSDQSLMELCLGRSGSISETLARRHLERPEWAAAFDVYKTLRAKADFVSPYRFFSILLGPMGGRSKFLARLGMEAAEPIDEFMAAALKYGETNTPSLRGFLFAIEATEADVKREPEVSGDLVRIMTVHGAKGLQSPLVIMPDTTGVPTVRDGLLWGQCDGEAIPIVKPRSERRCASLNGIMDEALRDEVNEHNRLLYVAMTRAEDHLIVCGTMTDGHPAAPESWYDAIVRGLGRIDGVEDVSAPDCLDWGGTMLVHQKRQEALPDRFVRSSAAQPVVLPEWVGTDAERRIAPPEADPLPRERIVPSRVGEEDAVDLTRGRPRFGIRREIAIRRGTAIHALLQYMPGGNAADLSKIALSYLEDLGIVEAEAEDILAQVSKVMAHPSLAPLFAHGSQAEVPVVAMVNDVEVNGTIDRLIVTGHEVRYVDFKSDMHPPRSAKGIPSAYRKQMVAYGQSLAVIFPDHRILGCLAWTSNGAVMDVFDTDQLHRVGRAQQLRAAA